jgi:hypothetical protein
MHTTFGIIPAGFSIEDSFGEIEMTQRPGARALAGPVPGVLLLAAAGCAPDAWKKDDAFDAWVDHVGRACYPNRIGHALVDVRLRNDAMFLDTTSRLYYKKIPYQQYETAVNTVAYGDNTRALNCIRDNLPK